MKRTGALRHRVVIEHRTVQPDGAGGQTVTWNDGATVWAAIEPLSGVELLRRDRVSGALTHRVSLRFRDDVVPEGRLRYGARIFEILVVRDVDERHRWLDCLCEEKNL